MTRQQLEEEILQLVNESQDMPYSDVQGVAQAIAMKAIKE